MGNAFRLKGDYNEVRDVNSGNKTLIFPDNATTVATVFLCFCIIGVVVYMAVAQAFVLTSAILIFFIAVSVCGLVILITYTRMKRREHQAIQEEHEAAMRTTRRGIRVIQSGPGWVLYLDQNGEVQYRGTVQMNKHLHLTGGEQSQQLLGGSEDSWDMGAME